MTHQKKLFNIYGATGGNFAGNVYDKEYIAPSLSTCGGGNQQPLIIETMEPNKKPSITLPAELQGKKFRIRKLTPRECFRLMGVDDADIDKIQAYPYESLVEHPAYSKEERFRGMTDKEKRAAMRHSISNSAQYKLAGNSVVAGGNFKDSNGNWDGVLFNLFRKMFIETGAEDGAQTLF